MSASDEILFLFLTVFLGTALGRLTWRGLSLGTSGVIFVALLVGHVGYRVPDSAGLLGLIVFVYCLGISAGPRFFRMFREQASSLALVGVTMILAAGQNSQIRPAAVSESKFHTEASPTRGTCPAPRNSAR